MKFRAWDKGKRKMCYRVNLYAIGNKDMKINKAQVDFAQIMRVIGLDCEVMRYTGLKDSDNKEVWAGDLRRYGGKLYKVVDEEWRFCLVRNLMEFGENESVPIGEDVAWESKLVGDTYSIDAKWWKT